jgi:hypothetical protein
MANRIRSYACLVAGSDWGETIVNARSRGQAKVDYWRDVKDAWPDIPFTAIRARVIGGPHSSAEFIRNAAYRGMPDVRCGQRVRVGEDEGAIVGHNSSANFDVLFDPGSRYGEIVLNVHPCEVTLL